ncbi:hypothetical protein NA57DRAFT_61419 [Rhizodiscina lignyota]|uniref:Uncharacterized protein n=1 Tax=Rhizodiscina lignyota TaxID=1504668 RepID=A0A9P4M0K7_9PEZI|nr:hypothetical protein NA57DRAFT_61419 [Rhizodiscina lignyota]
MRKQAPSSSRRPDSSGHSPRPEHVLSSARPRRLATARLDEVRLRGGSGSKARCSDSEGVSVRDSGQSCMLLMHDKGMMNSAVQAAGVLRDFSWTSRPQRRHFCMATLDCFFRSPYLTQCLSRLSRAAQPWPAEGSEWMGKGYRREFDARGQWQRQHGEGILGEIPRVRSPKHTSFRNGTPMEHADLPLTAACCAREPT